MDNFEVNEKRKMKGLKMVHLNIRSLFNKIDQLRTLFVDFDVIVVSETWLTPEITDASIELSGYRLFRQDRILPNGKKGGGLCLYAKSYLCVNVLETSCNIVSQDFELMGLSIKHPFIKPFNLISVYRPPNGKQQLLIKAL